MLYYIIRYDILLISPSVTNVERLLHRCEYELAWLDMSINFKQELNYRKQIARQLHINTNNNNTMTLKSGLEVTQCH